MKFIKEQIKIKGRGDGNTNTTKPKKQTTSITWKEVNFEREDVCKGQVIEEGMKGKIVERIHDVLNYHNSNFVEYDEKFGSNTKKEVASFQLKNKDKLKVTGKVDKDTWNLLYEGLMYACDAVTNSEIKTEPKDKNMENKTIEPSKEPKIIKVRRIGEQVQVKQSPEKTILNKAIKIKDNQGLSCMDRIVRGMKLKLNPEYGNAQFDITIKGVDRPAVVYLGINPNTKKEENYFVTSDGTKLLGVWQDGTEEELECEDQVATLGEFGNLSPRQKQFIQYNVTPESGYKVGVSPGEEGYYDKIDIVNTFKGASDYFAPNTYFIYKRKGYKVEERGDDFYNQIESTLNKVGWTYKKPDINTEAYSTKVDIRQKFPKYTEVLPDGLFIYFTGNTRSAKQQQLVSTLMSDIEKSVDSPDGKTCRDAINILWDAKQVFNKNIKYFTGDTELETVRTYVKQCQVKFEKNFFRFLDGGAKDKFEELKSKKYGPNGVMKFNLSENLNSLIKKKLLAIKEQKENNKIVKNIVESRLRMIVNSINKDKNIDRLSLSFMGELNQLNEQGLVNEDFGENLKNIFGSDLSSMPKTFFENIFDKILTNINMNDSSLKKSLVMMSEKNPSDIVKAFKDCSSMSDLIAKSIVEILHDDISYKNNSTGKALSSVKTLLGQEIKNDEFIQKVKNNIDDLVCQEFTKLKSNAENLISKIKGNSNNDLSGNL